MVVVVVREEEEEEGLIVVCAEILSYTQGEAIVLA
jgi:hypothetical protein